MPKWSGKWKGGRTYRTGDGRTVYVLRKMVQGRNYAITLDARNETEAEAELALFLRDPGAYQTKTEVQQTQKDAAVYLDPETVGRFLEYLKAQGRTERYVGNVAYYLAGWAEVLVGRDLRRLTLQEVLRELARHKTARKNRITALKSYTAWLREVEAVLPVSEDCTLALKVPAARPEKAIREKGYTIEEIQRLYRAINGWESAKYGWRGTGRVTDVQPVRDVLCIHAKTGMHSTEIERLARGEGKVTVLREHGVIAATIKFVHKSGRVHVQSIDHQTLAAVQRLQARGAAPVDSYIRKVVSRAAKSAGVEPVRFGELRHSFVTWASECGQEVRPRSGGLPLAAIAAVVGHQSVTTTKKFYENVKVPPMIKVPITLEHPEDPPYASVEQAVPA
ncbi:tyrosine-type recombinase/integrase [Stigmatella erecta]|uniref:Phage integrase family protein n=1 Tax=Stigmatella erecta TaxID=83460 RepID=A0A1I0KSL8_9BACT|nr:tyrosine-type recombinase/integrase [Stigmatella erecta]SEU28755.1 Phage integrase family protein [Stigmatella erecta]